MAKYWEDGQFYRFKVLNHLSPAVVVGIFLDYGNTEEVNINDIKPIHMLTHQPQYSEYEGEYSQGLCFSETKLPKSVG
ncbi:TDRD3 [Bugula neritina]|uniref:TDRD3 n=1 Tax=Bugula neritina TaxID=10212 RepID=A0A7J7ITY3_BUGNE|nr:TDRD3 [Bugula neritina]